MKKYFYLIILFCLTFTTEILYAQVKPLPVNASISLVPDEENLNVFQQWIKGYQIT